MDDVSIAKLKKQPIIIFPVSSILFDIYNRLIRPQIQASNQLFTYQKISFSNPTLFIKEGKKVFLVNNFEVFHTLKIVDSSQLLNQMISVIQISENQFRIDTVFYELIDIITRYQKILDIEAIYKDINEFLTPELNQQLFEKNIFYIPTFCNLISISEQTYYKRCKKGAENGAK